MKRVPMRALVEQAIGGGWGSSAKTDDSVLTRVLRGADFPDASVQRIGNAPQRWETETKVKKRTLDTGDIVLEVSGGTKNRPTGRSIYVTDKMVEESIHPLIPASFCRKIKVDREVANPRFVYYWLQSMYQSGRAWNYQNQSTGIANFQFEQFLDDELVWLPSLNIQTSVAMLLGSLDDKIAANQQIIGTATSLAESLVTRNLLTSEIRLGDVAQITMGTSPKGQYLKEEAGGLPFYQGVRDFGALTPQKRVFTENPVRKAEAEDILFAVRAPVGEVNIASEPTAIGRGLAAIRGRANHIALFYLLRAHPEIWNPHQDTGTVFASINKTDLSNAHIPEIEIDQPQSDLLTALHNQALVHTNQNLTLTKTRDELLPLLMSGKITVKEAEQEASAAGANIASEENKA